MNTYTIEQLRKLNEFAKEKNLYDSFNTVGRFLNILEARELELEEKEATLVNPTRKVLDEILEQPKPIEEVLQTNEPVIISIKKEDIEDKMDVTVSAEKIAPPDLLPCANDRCPTPDMKWNPAEMKHWGGKYYCGEKCAKRVYMREYFKNKPDKLHAGRKQERVLTERQQKMATKQQEEDARMKASIGICSNPLCIRGGKYVKGTGHFAEGLNWCTQECYKRWAQRENDESEALDIGSVHS